MVLRNQFDEQLQQLHDLLLKMGTMVEESVYLAVRSLIHKDVQLANQVVSSDQTINKLEIDIEKKCLNLIALQQPVGGDLRRIIATLKVSTDLERMADHAVSIAETAIELKDDVYAKPLIDIPKMAQIVKKMVHDVLEAYISSDHKAAKEIAQRDDKVDEFYQHIFSDLIKIMNEDTALIRQASYLLMVAQYIERIGDYVTNICESIVYLATGDSVELNN